MYLTEPTQVPYLRSSCFFYDCIQNRERHRTLEKKKPQYRWRTRMRINLNLLLTFVIKDKGCRVSKRPTAVVHAILHQLHSYNNKNEPFNYLFSLMKNKRKKQ